MHYTRFTTYSYELNNCDACLDAYLVHRTFDVNTIVFDGRSLSVLGTPLHNVRFHDLALPYSAHSATGIYA